MELTTRKVKRLSVASNQRKSNFNGIVTHSMMNTFCMCKKKFKFRYIDKLTAKEPNNNLIFGSLIHDCLEIWYKTKSSEAVFESIRLNRWKGPDSYDINAMAIVMMDNYIRKYKQDIFDSLTIEKEFIGKLSSFSPYIVAGKIDGIVKIHDLYFLLEHKTAAFTTVYNRQHMLKNDQQLLLYALAAKQILGIEVSGAIYNILMKPRIKMRLGETDRGYEERKAKLRRMNKSGRTSTRRIGKETHVSFLSRLERAYKENTMFMRFMVPIKQDQLDNIYKRTSSIIYDIKRCCAENNFYESTSSCTMYNSLCDYYNLCFSDDSPATAKELCHREAHSELSAGTLALSDSLTQQ